MGRLLPILGSVPLVLDPTTYLGHGTSLCLALPGKLDGLVKKYSRLPVRGFCVLIAGDDDRLDVLVAPVLSGSEAARLF